MKPLNSSEPGCNYTTSNCVIWQGPNLPCINLCKGDTVSDVVFKMATELCDVLDTLKISSYDLSCFNLTSCAPDDFKQLIQFLIERICKLEQCTGCIPNCDGTVTPPVPPNNGNTGCPDCVVAIAPCFYYVNELGDTVTSMQLQDYVTAIGNRICSDVQNINAQQKTLNNHEQRITVLETTPPPVYVPPTIVPTGVLPSVPQSIKDVLIATEEQFVQLRSATGFPDTIYQNIGKQPQGLNQEKTLSGTGGVYSGLPGWASSVSNEAQSIGNMWLVINDIRQAIKTIQLNCCPTGCDGIELVMTANLDTSFVTVYVNGTIPSGFVQCSGDTKVQITDSQNGSATFTMNLIAVLNNPTGVQFNLTGTPINPSLDLTVVIQPCLTDASISATCQSYLTYQITNSSSCPNVTYTMTQGSVQYSFISQVGDYTYNFQVWDALGGTMIANQIQAISGPQTVTGEIVGLTAGTVYKVRLVIQPTACPTCEPTTCPFSNVVTNPPTCPAPTSVSAGLTIP